MKLGPLGKRVVLSQILRYVLLSELEDPVSKPGNILQGASPAAEFIKHKEQQGRSCTLMNPLKRTEKMAAET